MDSSEPGLITIGCSACGLPFMHQDEQVGDLMMPRPVLCEPCLQEGLRKSQIALQKAPIADPAIRFRAIALDGYAESDLTHPGLHPEALAASQNWSPNHAKGLGLVGKAGLGKSRCIHLALRTAFASGRRCFAINHYDFGESAHEASAAETVAEKRIARELLHRARTAGVLLLDDIGKSRHTPARTEALYALLEYRTTRGLLTLWTSQASAKYLSTQYGPDYGPAIARRLGPEFCIIPSLPRE
jgi:hypothetical protein